MRTLAQSNSLRIWSLVGICALGLLSFALGYNLDAITFKSLLLIIFGLVGGILMSLPLDRAFLVFFAYLGFEGMIKLISNYNPVVHVGADLFVGVLSARLVLAYIMKRVDLPRSWPPFMVLFALHWAWFFVEFMNPYSLGLVPSLAGAKLYVTMVILYFYGYYLTRTARDARVFMGVWVLTAIIQVVTSLYQAAIGPSSVLSISPHYAEPLEKFAGFAFRPFGTTHLPGLPAIFISLAAPFLVYFVMFSRNWLLRIFLLVMLPAATVAISLCQVRSALMKAIIGSAAFLVIGLASASRETRKRLAIGIPIVVTVLVFALPKLTSHWVEERGENAAAIDRTLTLFDFDRVSQSRSGAKDRIVDYMERVPLGAGLSRTGAAAGAFWELAGNDIYFPGGFFTDNFWAATIAEIGIPGSLILTSIFLAIALRGALSLRRTKDPELIALQAAVLCATTAVLLGLWGAEGVLYNPEAAFYWFFVGVLMKLPKLEKPIEALKPQPDAPLPQLSPARV